MRIHSDQLPDSIVRHFRQPRPRVDQTLRGLKAASRIPAGRPFAPPLDARDVARITIGLAAPTSGGAVAFEREVGRLTDNAGRTAESAMAAIASGAEADQVAVAADFVEIRSAGIATVFGLVPAGVVRLTVIPAAAIRAVGQEIIGKSNEYA
jgi:hypothetical protein